MTRLVVSLLGVLAGLAGIEHGIGEVLQGGTVPPGLVFPSWPDSRLMAIFGGEPAMSVIPNFTASGIFSILLSLLLIAWSVVFIGRRHGGLTMMIISVALLLVGGGFGPPLLGIILGAAGTRIGKPLTWWRAHLPRAVRRFLSAASPVLSAACFLAWVLMMPGPMIIGRLFKAEGFDGTAVVPYFILAAFATLPLAIVAGFARDVERARERRGTAASPA